MEQGNYYNDDLSLLFGVLFAFVACMCILDCVFTKIQKIPLSNIKGSELL